MTDLEISRGTAEDWPAISGLLALAFHNTPREEAAWGNVFEPARSLLVRDAGAVVAHAGAFTRELSVPGATVPAAHVTMVGVAPTHRRRRLLTRLMHRQLGEVPEPVAVLWASEGQIYPRFGYGLASQRVSVRVETHEVGLPEPATPAPLRLLPTADARPAMQRLYESVRGERPGWSSRSERWWDRRLSDPPDRREGSTELRATVREVPTYPGEIDGYALWRSRQHWDANGPAGEVQVEELVAATPEAHLQLWRFLLSVDLTRYASLWLTGLDDPLLYLANEPRRLGAALGDGLFVRIVDLPAALTARRYATPLEVVFEVTDPLLTGNAGRWRLSTDGDKTTCVRTDEPADLACGIGELASAYLGGIGWGALAGAGRVRELRPGAVAAASAAFGWHRAPTGMEIF